MLCATRRSTQRTRALGNRCVRSIVTCLNATQTQSRRIAVAASIVRLCESLWSLCARQGQRCGGSGARARAVTAGLQLACAKTMHALISSLGCCVFASHDRRHTGDFAKITTTTTTTKKWSPRKRSLMLQLCMGCEQQQRQWRPSRARSTIITTQSSGCAHRQVIRFLPLCACSCSRSRSRVVFAICARTLAKLRTRAIHAQPVTSLPYVSHARTHTHTCGDSISHFARSRARVRASLGDSSKRARAIPR